MAPTSNAGTKPGRLPSITASQPRRSRRRPAKSSPQVDKLGNQYHKALSGLIGAADKFKVPLVNAHASPFQRTETCGNRDLAAQGAHGYSHSRLL